MQIRQEWRQRASNAVGQQKCVRAGDTASKPKMKALENVETEDVDWESVYQRIIDAVRQSS